MSLIYDGLISDELVDRIREAARDGFTFAVEVYPLPRDYTDCLKTRNWTSTHDGCVGESYTRAHFSTRSRFLMEAADFMDDSLRDENHHYLGRGFLLLLDDEDRQTFVNSFPDNVVNPNPFRTVL